MRSREPFLLDPDVVLLNHGSFGATPAPVFDEYQRLQLEMERQPVRWLQREADDRLAVARAALASYVGCDADELVYFPNPTQAINMVVRSLHLARGDEVLTTDHEYGAMDRTWRVVCAEANARYVQAHIPVPLPPADEVVERIWAGVTSRTKVLFISHITSATAVRFPVEELVRRANEAGIITIVDGAHVPGHIPLDVRAVGADFYTGANHKWLCAPKGSTFLYARRDVQPMLKPLVVSWGWESLNPSGSTFIDHHEWQGTRDLAPFLATPAAIEWTQAQGWAAQQQRSHDMVAAAIARVAALTGLPSMYPDDGFAWFGQMAVALLPDVDVVALKAALYDEFCVELPVHRFADQPMLRISIAAYNDESDIDALIGALTALLPQLAG
ncbi:MAG: aminotransferase class V-fold PLP-dependent enzyme [Ilumatobacteraceae bacterium]